MTNDRRRRVESKGTVEERRLFRPSIPVFIQLSSQVSEFHLRFENVEFRFGDSKTPGNDLRYTW